MRYIYTSTLYVACGFCSSLSPVVEYSGVHGQDHDLPPTSRAACTGGDVSGEFRRMRVTSISSIAAVLRSMSFRGMALRLTLLLLQELYHV